MGLSPGYTLPWVLNGVRGGIIGLPGVGFIPGLGPCISTVVPCGMLPIRTMVGTFPRRWRPRYRLPVRS